MNVGIFRPTSPPEHTKALDAFAAGLEVSGVDHFITDMAYHPCDVAVVFGVGKKRIPISWPRGTIIKKHRAEGKPVIILETGYIKRERYFAAGWNGLNGRANFRNQGMPPDRWKALNIEPRPWRADGEIGRAHV